MRALLCAGAVLLATASPAAAATFTGRADAGPAIAGDTVIWSQGYSNGTGVLKQDGRVIGNWVAPTASEGFFDRRISSVSGSATRIAYALENTGEEDAESNTTTTFSVASPWSSSGGGAFTNPLGCLADSITTAVEGDTVVLGVNRARSTVHRSRRCLRQRPQDRRHHQHLAGADRRPLRGLGGRRPVPRRQRPDHRRRRHLRRDARHVRRAQRALGPVRHRRAGQHRGHSAATGCTRSPSPSRRGGCSRATSRSTRRRRAGGRVAYIYGDPHRPEATASLADLTGKVLKRYETLRQAPLAGRRASR